MANVIENIIRARDEATPTLRLVRTEVQSLRGALAMLPPAATAALGPLRSLTLLPVGGLTAATVGLTGLAVSIGAVVAAAKLAVTEVAALGERAERISNIAQSAGVSVAAIQGLQAALENAGIPAEALTMAFRTLNRAIADQDPALKTLGITTKDTFEAFQQLSDLFARSADGPNKTAIAVKLLGRSGQELIPVMNDGSDAIQRAIDRARDLGIAFSDDAVAGLVAADNAFDELRNRVDGLKNQLTLLAVPAVSGAVEQLNELLAVALKLPQAFDDAKFAISLMIKESVPGFEQLAKAVAVIQTLISAAEKLQRAQDQIRKTGAQFPSTVPVMPDSVEPPPPDISPPPAKTDREKMLDRLQELLSLTRREAQLAFADLKRLDDSAAALALEEKLRKARGLTGAPHAAEPIIAGETPGIKAEDFSRSIQERIAQQKFLDAILLEDTEKTAEAMALAIENRMAAVDFRPVVDLWRAAAEQMLIPARILDQGFSALWNGLQTGFQNAFANILTQTGALKSAMVSIMRALVSEFLALLARLAAAKIFRLVVSAVAAPLTGGASLIIGGFSKGGEVEEPPTIRITPLAPMMRSIGGLIYGPGTETSDDIPVKLSRGEYVVKAAAVKKPGVLKHLEAVNAGIFDASAVADPRVLERAAARPAAGLIQMPARVSAVIGQAGGQDIVLRPVVNVSVAREAAVRPAADLSRAREQSEKPEAGLSQMKEIVSRSVASISTVREIAARAPASSAQQQGPILRPIVQLERALDKATKPEAGLSQMKEVISRSVASISTVREIAARAPASSAQQQGAILRPVVEFVRTLDKVAKPEAGLSRMVDVVLRQTASSPAGRAVISTPQAPAVIRQTDFRMEREIMRSFSRMETLQTRIIARADFSGIQERAETDMASPAPATPELARRPARGDRGGNTYVIQAINARDAIMSLSQPGGELRRAMDSVEMLGAY